jgi:membrane protein implicated in regulation of membrane protease activity
MDTLHWYWWIAGLLLMVAEAFAPGAFFLWIGLSALAVGAVVYFAPGIGITAEVLLFAVLAIGSVLAVRRLRTKKTETPGETRLNERGRLYEGRVFTLEAPIADGIGSLRVDDGQWRVAGPDLPAGARVRVLTVEGATLRVEKAD